MRYAMTVSHLNLGDRRRAWAEPEYERRRPETRDIGTAQRPTDPPGGLVAVIGEDGGVERELRTWVPQGVMPHDGGLLVAGPWRVSRVDRELRGEAPCASHPSFSLLHSLRPTRRGALVASTGVDAAIELDRSGAVAWEWWACDHGFDEDALGAPRRVDRGAEHRGLTYDTKVQATHLNAAAALDERTVLACLFHQGAVAAVDRATGRWRTVLDGLVRPHGVRVVAPGAFTVADTGRGRALLVRTDGRTSAIEREVALDTPWLQGAELLDDGWLLVDGAAARVVLADRTGAVREEHRFPPDWRLYEAVPLDAGRLAAGPPQG